MGKTEDKTRVLILNEHSSLDDAIFVEKVDALYKSLLASAVANILIATTLVLMLWEAIDHSILIVWLAIMSAINVVRIMSYLLYLKDTKDLKKYYFWGRVFIHLMTLTAITWGCVSLWLLPANDSIYHYLPILILIGVSAGAITSLGYNMKYILVYFIALLLPVFITELIIASYLSNLIAGLIVLFTVVALANGKRFNKTFIENIELQYASEKNRQEIISSKNAAIEANKSKSSFISMISHELRTPLNGILGFAQLLKMSEAPVLNEEQAEQTDGIVDSGKHLLSLIEELLELSRIEAHKLSVEINTVLLNSIVDESLAILKPVANEFNIHIINNIEFEHLVEGDPKRIKQVLINFISNAIKYNHEDGHVTISAKEIGDKLRISIVDDGDGLTEQQQEYLFNAFQRFNTEKEGLGLGLYITQNIVELMKGEIGVESEVNKGSTFWFELPLT